ncbi:protein TolB [Streptomyces sp. NPDC050549]|uniref:TolB family protein n=1 Tax=Streptomyces sp. NPDC050549 TaxID=3155406 RepID=UPI00341E1AC0
MSTRTSSISSGAGLLLVFAVGVVPAAAAPHAPRLQRISTAADGTQADGASGGASITPNGRFVAFRSSATDLVPDPGHGPDSQAYVRDLRTGTVGRVAALGTPVLSTDGRWAASTDWGTHDIDVFLTDRTTGTRTRIDGAALRDSAYDPTISADGRYVAYQYVTHPQFPTRIDVYDRITGTHETVSAGPQDDGSRDMSHPSISGDGRLVAYQDDGTGDVWVADRRSGGQTEADDGTRSTLVQLSADGRTLAMNSADGAYVRDLRTGRVRHLPGVQARAVSPDGRQLLYADGQSALHLRDLRTGADHTVADATAAASAGAGAVSDRGVVFSSAASDLVPDDTNAVADVFVRR